MVDIVVETVAWDLEMVAADHETSVWAGGTVVCAVGYLALPVHCRGCTTGLERDVGAPWVSGPAAPGAWPDWRVGETAPGFCETVSLWKT